MSKVVSSIYEDRQWWSVWRDKDKRGESEAGAYLCGLMDEMKLRQTTLQQNTQRLLSIYQYGYKGGDPTHPEDDVTLDECRSSYNAARNTVDTAWCKIIKSRILPMPLTSGGGYLARARARDIGRGIEGEFDENNLDEIKESVVLDALTTYHGAGADKVFTRNGRVCMEHVPIEDLRFDEIECRYRKPRSIFQTARWDRYMAAETFSRDEDGKLDKVLRRKVLDAPQATTNGVRSRVSHDQIEIYEAWHLPSCAQDDDEDEPDDDGDDDGRHVIAIVGATVLDARWRRDHFPFAIYVPRKRTRSMWGLGMMFDLAAPQREYETITAKIQVAHQKMGMSGFMAPRNANANEAEIANKAGIFVEFDGQVPPIAFTPQPVHPDQYAYAAGIPQNMMQTKGISMLAAQSQLPAGLQQASGKALQVFEDFESERLLPEHRELERWHIANGWLVYEEARDIAKRDSSYSVRYRNRRGFDTVIWKDIAVDRKDFVLRVYPVSSLSKHPSARYEQLMERFQAGVISAEAFRRLDEFPDLEAEDDLENADVNIIDKTLDLIATKGRPAQAQSFDNLAMIVKRGGQFYNLRRLEAENDVPETRMQMIREYIQSAQALIDEALAAQAPPPPPPGMTAGPGPMMPPDAGGGPPLGPMNGAPPGMGSGGDVMVSDARAKQEAFEAGAQHGVMSAWDKAKNMLGMGATAQQEPVGVPVVRRPEAPAQAFHLSPDELVRIPLPTSSGAPWEEMTRREHEALVARRAQAALDSARPMTGPMPPAAPPIMTSDVHAKQQARLEGYEAGHGDGSRGLPLLDSQILEHGLSNDVAYEAEHQAERLDDGGARWRDLQNFRASQQPHPMDQFIESARGQPYEYRPEVLGTPGTSPGTHYGPMAQNLQQSPVGAQMVVQDPHTGLLGVDKDKALQATMAGLAHVNDKVEALGGSDYEPDSAILAEGINPEVNR